MSPVNFVIVRQGEYMFPNGLNLPAVGFRATCTPYGTGEQGVARKDHTG